LDKQNLKSKLTANDYAAIATMIIDVLIHIALYKDKNEVLSAPLLIIVLICLVVGGSFALSFWQLFIRKG